MSNKFLQSGDVPGLSPFGVRRSVRRIVAGSEIYSWIQQSLTFELIENIGSVSSPGFGRCVRISTLGTVISTAGYRGGKSQRPPDLLARSLKQQLDWMNEIQHRPEAQHTQLEHLNVSVRDNRMVLDDLHFTIEATSPRDPSKANTGNEWILIDVSPSSKNNATGVSTSTSLGFNAGVFGDTLTAGVDFSTATSREWTLPDYEVMSMSGLGRHLEPRATWNVKRTVFDADPAIARSSLQPIFEVVFGLRPQVFPKRFSSITTMMTLTFIQTFAYTKAKDDKAANEVTSNVSGVTDKVKAAPIGPGLFAMDLVKFGNTVYNLVEKVASDQKSPATQDLIPAPEALDGRRLEQHSFLMTFVIDWELGTVSAYVLDSQASGRSPTLSSISNGSSDKVGHADWISPSDASSLLEPELPEQINVPQLAMEYRDRSSIGIVNPTELDKIASSTGTLTLTYDVHFPMDRLAQYSDRFVIYNGYPSPEIAKDTQWLPFKRSARISSEVGKGLIWSAPEGYTRDYVWVPTGVGSFFAPPVLFNSVDKIGLPEVPDSYYRFLISGDGNQYLREYIAFRDHIYISDRTSITQHRSCFDYLTSAVFTQGLSIGIAQGQIVCSMDQFKTAGKDIERIPVSDLPADTGNTLGSLLNGFIAGAFNFWMFSVADKCVVVSDEQVAEFSLTALAHASSSIPPSPIVPMITPWRDLVERWSADPDKSLKSAAAILDRTGIRKPIAGWARSATMDGIALKSPNSSEMFFQKAG